MAYQRVTSSAGLGNRSQQQQIHLRTNSSGSVLNSLKNLDIATEDDVDEETETTFLKEKYSSASHPYYNTPAVSQYHHVKPLVLFSLDITHWSPIVQYIFLIGGLILFMCLYGYYQELVIYGWFNRRLSWFSTFLHFLGCTGFAQLQRNISTAPPLTTTNSNAEPPSIPVASKGIQGYYNRFLYVFRYYSYSFSSYWNISMGTATTGTAIGYYFLLVCMKTLSQGLSNLSMTEINYPAKVLFKSANPIITIFLGIVWFKKTYPLKDYIVVGLLLCGLYVFITDTTSQKAHHNTRPECTPLGIFYVILSMIGSALVPMIQEHAITTYNASIEDLLYYCFLGSTIVSLLLSMVNGEFIGGMVFLWNNSSFHIWFVFICFCTFGFVGSNFSTAITAHYGSLVNGLSNTIRKAVTMVLSFIMFPERNELTVHKVYGAMIFFAGLLVSTFMGDEKHKHGKGGGGSSGKSQKQLQNDSSVKNSGDAIDVEEGGGGLGGRGGHGENNSLLGGSEDEEQVEVIVNTESNHHFPTPTHRRNSRDGNTLPPLSSSGLKQKSPSPESKAVIANSFHSPIQSVPYHHSTSSIPPSGTTGAADGLSASYEEDDNNKHHDPLLQEGYKQRHQSPPPPFPPVASSSQHHDHYYHHKNASPYAHQISPNRRSSPTNRNNNSNVNNNSDNSVYNTVYNNLSAFYQNLTNTNPSTAATMTTAAGQQGKKNTKLKTGQELFFPNSLNSNNQNGSEVDGNETNEHHHHHHHHTSSSEGEDSDDSAGRRNRYKKHQFTV
jgi:adenosine 3'-phospho 5'-phosphosulfate transporter B3